MTSDDLDTQAPHKIKKPRRPRTRSVVSWLALLAILIAVGAWFQLVHQQKKSRNNYSQLQNSFSQAQSSTAELSSDVAVLQAQIKAQNETLTNLAAAFNRSQAAHSEQEIDNNLMVVEHYLIQANLSLNFNHNISDAIALLQTADSHLSNVTDPSITALRSQIATALVKLRALPQPDLVGLLTQISAIQNQVRYLPLFALTTKTDQFKKVDNSSVNTQESLSAKSWRLSLATLKSLVIIRHREQPVTPLLAPMQEQYLRQNLQLILQQASWAVLQQNQSVYLYSLHQARTWLQRYFADNDSATQALDAQLKTLSSVNVAPIAPDLAPLLQNLQRLQSKLAENISIPTTLKPNTNTKTSLPAQTKTLATDRSTGVVV